MDDVLFDSFGYIFFSNRRMVFTLKVQDKNNGAIMQVAINYICFFLLFQKHSNQFVKPYFKLELIECSKWIW